MLVAARRGSLKDCAAPPLGLDISGDSRGPAAACLLLTENGGAGAKHNSTAPEGLPASNVQGLKKRRLAPSTHLPLAEPAQPPAWPTILEATA